ncbi:hypothetical protein ACTWP4_00230 [Gracilibacillus sp. D59]|uniref:hypothetical protein n=1 Tax=Gracilibacillus sp. D59 TaxID=3457434 RepID=UPI003FCD6BC5
MIVSITNVSMNYEQNEVKSVTIQFKGQTEDRTIHVNGRFSITSEQYNENSNLDALQGIVRQHVADKIMEGSN